MKELRVARKDLKERIFEGMIERYVLIPSLMFKEIGSEYVGIDMRSLERFPTYGGIVRISCSFRRFDLWRISLPSKRRPFPLVI